MGRFGSSPVGVVEALDLLLAGAVAPVLVVDAAAAPVPEGADAAGAG
jgi:hypothetical protein